jgi:Mrp family chromosome partitioning ATPase/capsular polysaccharide biosynthesis protein
VGSTAFDSGSSGKARTYYKATNTLVLDTSNQQNGSFQSAFANLDQIAILTTTGDVPGLVAKKLGVDQNDNTLSEHIITTVNGSTNTLELTAVEPTPEQAVAVANAFADQLTASLATRDTDRYHTQSDFLSNRITTLTATVTQLTGQLAFSPNDKVIAAQLNTAQNELGNSLTEFGTLTATGPPASRLSSLEQAQAVPINQAEYNSRINLGALGQNHLDANSGSNNTPTIVSSTSSTSLNGPVARGILGALLGLLAGIGFALLAERLNRKIRTHQDAEAAFGLPVLAEVPRLARTQQSSHEIVAAAAPLSRVAEAYRAVRSSLLFARATMAGPDVAPKGVRQGELEPGMSFEPEHGEPFVVMVTSPAPGEGKTTTTANLAAVFAEAGSSVLVVNCDFRRPAIHQFFGITDEPRRVHETSVPGVKLVTNVLSDPTANPSQVVAAQRQVVNAARGRFDVILLDTAPLLTANDAAELVGSADLVLLVARSEMTSVDSATRAIDLLNRLEAPLGGVVVCGVKSVSNDYYYYYQPGRVDPRKSPGKGAAAAIAPATNGNGRSTTSGDLFPSETEPIAPPDGTPKP